MPITERDLPFLNWDDIAILEMPDNVFGLIFLCKDQDSSTSLYGLLRDGINIKVFDRDDEDKLMLTITFPGSEFALDFITGRTITKYPPLQWLKDGKVSHYTTGYREGQGRLQWLDNFRRLELQ